VRIHLIDTAFRHYIPATSDEDELVMRINPPGSAATVSAWTDDGNEDDEIGRSDS